jgi:hypothetical protein
MGFMMVRPMSSSNNSPGSDKFQDSILFAFPFAPAQGFFIVKQSICAAHASSHHDQALYCAVLITQSMHPSYQYNRPIYLSTRYRLSMHLSDLLLDP